MGFFDLFKRTPALANVTNVDYVQPFIDPWQRQPVYFDIKQLTAAEMWRTQPHLRTVVSFLARNIAQLGLHVYERVGETDRERDRDSLLSRLLLQPNSETTATELIWSLVADMSLYDDGFWYIGPDNNTPTGWSIVRLPPEWVVPQNLDAFRRSGYIIKAPQGDQVKLTAEQVISFHGYNPVDPRSGSTAIDALKGVLQEQLQSSNYRQQVWRNGGRVSAVLTRPPGSPQWSPEARERFRADWYAAYAGNGPKAGGTPILDDGMTLQKVDFSAADQQFVEGAKLSFQVVCSAYHVNPTMVGLLDNANYSNVREFRRALYGDTLGPLIAQIESRINTFLLPMLGMDNTRYYAEFNVSEKLQGNFEEQAAVMQTMVGAPVMTRNEGRARLNLPELEGASELIVPMNVTVGGQASPTDSGEQNVGEEPPAVPPATNSLVTQVDWLRPATKTAKGKSFRAMGEQTMRDFFSRQEVVVLSALGAKSPSWWDGKRWDRELSEDIAGIMTKVSVAAGKSTAKRLGGTYEADMTKAWIEAVSARIASDINGTTLDDLKAALTEDDPAAAAQSVFTVAKSQGAIATGGSLVAQADGFGTTEAARQIGGSDATKTWYAGANPRASHAAMNGETVGIDEQFSNGADWPGDSALDAAERAGCNCYVEVEIP